MHCGAGVSRSAALVIAYLMRRFTWPAERAREHCRARRSLVNPNQGFWRQLCAIEAQLGITQRCAHAARPIVLLRLLLSLGYAAMACARCMHHQFGLH